MKIVVEIIYRKTSIDNCGNEEFRRQNQRENVKFLRLQIDKNFENKTNNFAPQTQNVAPSNQQNMTGTSVSQFRFPAF